MSNIVVQKYGGSSVSDISGIRRVAQRIVETVQSGWSVVVVVSAMGNTTNELISLAKEISDTPTRRELDLLVSVGERISMTLLAMAVEQLGVKAKSFTGSQSGIITDENHVAATILSVHPHRISQALDEGYVAIVAGFQGMSRQKEVTTLGRGGSDTTAVALTAALQAEFCEICSDVDGVYSADPRVVSTAQKWKDMSLHSAWLLAKHGAKVLQAAALEYALDQKIDLVANATHKPMGHGTKLLRQKENESFGITSKVLRWFCMTSSSQPVAIPDWIDTAMTHCWADAEGIQILVDPDNLHGLFELPEGMKERNKVVAISVVGVANCDVMFKYLIPNSIHWWRSPGVWTALFQEWNVTARIQILHDALCV